MQFDLGAGLAETMKERELNSQRTEHLRKLRDELGYLLRKEVIQRAYKESAAEVADEMLAEIRAVDEGRLDPSERRFSDPRNAELRNQDLVRRVEAGAKKHGVRLTPDEVRLGVDLNYLR